MIDLKTPYKIQRTPHSRISELDTDSIPFGRIFADHMLVCDYADGKWEEPVIVPYGKMLFSPSISALHYGQSIFEGMKAFKNSAGEPLLFRARDNYERMNRSAARLCMPEIPEDIFLGGLRELVSLDRDWIPNKEGYSLYLRPFYFATDEYVGIRPSETYKFIIFSCPVGAYYPEPVNLLISDEFVRASERGTGESKAAGNYAASLLGAKRAQEKGYHNVIWVDAKEYKYVEECGTMNIFFVIDGVAITPSLTGTILRGVTRHSVITLLRDKGIPVEERRITAEEIYEAHKAGKLNEAFGTGTAATIAHVNKIGFKGEDMQLPPISERKIGPWLLQTLSDLRTQKIEDPHGWVEKI